MTRFAIITFACCLLSGVAAQAQQAQQAPARPAVAAPGSPAALSPDEQLKRRDWQKTIAQIPMPKKGCFTAVYPNRTWQPVPCGEATRTPFQPAHGPRPFNIGGGNDVAAFYPAGAPSITSSTGRFDTVSAGTTIQTQFSLQISANTFATTTSGCNTVSGCVGWQQYVYSSQTACANNLPCVLIEYWLLNYGTCPSAAWTQSGNSCYINSAVTQAPAIAGSQLQGTTLTGTASGGTDTIVLTTPGGGASGMSADSLLNMEGKWNTSEFNIFGDGGGGQATLSATTIDARTEVTNGTGAAPQCVASGSGFTGETNNLSFGPSAPPASQPGPAVLFEESTAGGAPAACAAATTVGDTHLGTYNGLAYDFQGAGDFVLSETEPDFLVQNRQVSGAPTWPDAAVNHGIATRMGKTSVALCMPAKGDDLAVLFVDGKATPLASGHSIAAPGGVQIWRMGDQYTVTSASGDSVRAQANAIPGGTRWINVSVGQGHWPARVRGLLANANNNVNQIAARNGTVFTRPFAFSDIYGPYGESWRVPADASLLTVCGGRTEAANPKAPFYAGNLEPSLRKRGQAVCTAARVRPGPLLENCILDVAVIGGDAAAKVFVGARAPVADGKIVAGNGTTAAPRRHP